MTGKGEEEWEKNGHWIMVTVKVKMKVPLDPDLYEVKLKSTDLLAYEVI